MKLNIPFRPRPLAAAVLATAALIVGVPTAAASQTFAVDCSGAGSQSTVTVTPGETVTFTVANCNLFETSASSLASTTIAWSGTPSPATAPTTPAPSPNPFGQLDKYEYTGISSVVVVLGSSGVFPLMIFRTSSSGQVRQAFTLRPANPEPTPAPAPAPAPTPAATVPAPPPALPAADIPAEITLDIGASTGSADQPITAEVPCTAPEGQLLDRCTVNVTAPEYVLLGQGDGINVRAEKRVSIGKATVKAKSGRKTIVVKVKINQRGRKALTRNLQIEATVGLTAITVSNQRSTGAAETTMRLPTQLISPQQGIFDSNSTTLNRAGVAFVNRLAKLLPATPKDMVFIGFTDITGVPGDNRWIADRRAKAVRDALEAKGVDPARSSIEVKAAQSPRDDNATDQGRERNRRVSIRITY